MTILDSPIGIRTTFVRYAIRSYIINLINRRQRTHFRACFVLVARVASTVAMAI